jgi:hypothetical protein
MSFARRTSRTLGIARRICRVDNMFSIFEYLNSIEAGKIGKVLAQRSDMVVANHKSIIQVGVAKSFSIENPDRNAPNAVREILTEKAQNRLLMGLPFGKRLEYIIAAPPISEVCLLEAGLK